MSSRRNQALLVVTLLVTGIALAAFGRGPLPAEGAQHAESARAALKPFKQQLMAALQKGLAEGAEAAVDACRLEAPRIARAHASETVRVGRTSHRLRNPANAPKPWMQPILDEFVAAEPGAIQQRVVELGSGWVGYAEPIYVQPLCSKCHGASLSPELASRIQEAYPEDRATGFAAGDFRGLFWVELATGAGGS